MHRNIYRNFELFCNSFFFEDMVSIQRKIFERMTFSAKKKGAKRTIAKALFAFTPTLPPCPHHHAHFHSILFRCFTFAENSSLKNVSLNGHHTFLNYFLIHLRHPLKRQPAQQRWTTQQKNELTQFNSLKKDFDSIQLNSVIPKILSNSIQLNSCIVKKIANSIQ
jgi:hypothetical protein